MREERAVERSTPPHLKQKTRLHRLQGERERWNRVRAVDKLELGLGWGWGSHQCMASQPETFSTKNLHLGHWRSCCLWA